MKPSRARVSGDFAGPVSRLVAYVVDAFLITALFTALVAVTTYFIDLVFDVTVDTGEDWWTFVLWVVWAFLYCWVGLAIAGRTPGMLLIGMKVVRRDGRPLPPGAAFVRVVTFPLSLLLLCLGLVGIVVGRERRALHDVLAGSVVVYDWGDRPAELPAPLTRWIADHGTPAPEPEPAPAPVDHAG
jgi:uncharacterized RDD family membrane protein YckC